MDPQLKSVLTTIGAGGASAVAAWAVSKGLITASDQAADANILLGAAGIVVTGLIAWYKARQHTPTAQIQAVRAADNGVTVVPTAAAVAAGIPSVSAPLKEPGK